MVSAAACMFPVALNALVHTKFKVIDGYSDSGVVLLAVDRGEIHGACQSAETLLHARGDAIRSGNLRAVLQGGMQPNPKFPGVPFVLDLAKNEEQRPALRFLYSSQMFGRPYVAPPDVPPERVAALRKAFTDMFRDRDFRADAARQDYHVNPISGEDMTALIEELAKAPKPIIDEVAALIEPLVGQVRERSEGGGRLQSESLLLRRISAHLSISNLRYFSRTSGPVPRGGTMPT
jgi:hypothetical protein